MRKKIKNRAAGFTLVELMVVIAIIAFLSAIILVSLQNAKARAYNGKRLEMVKQYANAIELYRSDNSSYPNYPTFGNPPVCLGEGSAATCQNGNATGDSSLDTLLKKYIPGSPAMTDVVNGSSIFHGLTYQNCSLAGSSCYGSLKSGYELYWFMSDQSQPCGGGVNTGRFISPTVCAYDAQ